MTPPEAIDRVIEQLELGPDQADAIDSVLARRREQSDATMQRALGELRIVVDSATREVRAILNERQLVAYDSLMAIERSRYRLRQPQPSR